MRRKGKMGKLSVSKGGRGKNDNGGGKGEGEGIQDGIVAITTLPMP